MVHSLGAQIGLVAFAVAILAGLHAGNSATTILTRALLALVLAVFAGQFSSFAIRLVLRDHMKQKKEAVERETAPE